MKLFGKKSKKKEGNKIVSKTMKLFLAMSARQEMQGNHINVQNLELADIDGLLINSLKGTNVNYLLVKKISEAVVEEYCFQIDALHQKLISIQNTLNNNTLAMIDFGLDDIKRYLNHEFQENELSYLKDARQQLLLGMDMLYKSIPGFMSPVLQMPDNNFKRLFTIRVKELDKYNDMSINAIKYLNNAFEMLLICESELNIKSSDTLIQRIKDFYDDYIFKAGNNEKMNEYNGNDSEGDFWTSEVKDFYDRLKLYSAISSEECDEIDIDGIIF